MCKVQMLRSLVKQRLTAAAEEIFGLFERTIAEYEEELSRSKEENERQRKLLDAVLNPQLRLHRAGIQQQLVSKEEVPPEQREWSSSLDQEDPEPPHIKEEQEKLWTSQEGEQLQGLEEADISKFPFTPVPVKSEDDEEEAQSSQLHQRQTEDCGGPEPDTDDMTGDSEFKIEFSDDDWTETTEPDSGFNSKNNGYHPDRKSFCCSESGKQFCQNSNLKTHMRIHTGEKPDPDDETSQCYKQEIDDSDDAWEETMGPLSGLNSLQNIEVPLSDIEFSTGNTPVSSSECARSFSHEGRLQKHNGIQTGEKPFICFICGKGSTQKGHLRQHMRIHTGEKPFSCSVCGKGFAQKQNLRRHVLVHKGEKPFSCGVCNKRFTRLHGVKTHKCVGESSRIK